MNGKFFKCICLAAFVMTLLVCFISNCPKVYADDSDAIINLGTAATVAGLHNPDIAIVIGNVIRFFLAFTGLILIVFIVYGGITWAMSGGNEESIKKAKGIMTNAVIGLAIVFLAYALSSFIIQRLQEIGASPSRGS